MKAKFFFLGLCALALAACSIDEVSQVNDTNAVTFKATTITRADVTTTNNLQAFSVWAWNTSDYGTNEFMDDVIATRNGTSSTFTTSPLYFWPTGTVDFYALAPATGVTAIEDNVEYAFLGGEINEGDDVNPNWTYEGYVAKAQIANGNIVIDACIPSLPEDQIDLCYGVALEKSSGSVPMNFRHALSQIAFKAKSANTAFDVKIADVSVCSVYKEGVYTIGAKETSTHLDEGTSTSPAAGTQGVWELTTTDDYGYAIKGRYLVDMTDNIVEVPTDGDVVELVDPYGTLMLLPQTIVAWDPLTDYSDTELGSYLRILCHVEESGSQLWPNNAAESEETDLEATGAFWKDAEGVEYAEIAIPLTNVEWEQGYRYTYTLIFGEGLGYYPPDDPNTDLEGKPVLDIITFDVTVDEFQDAENTDGKYDVSTDTDLSYIEVSTQAELLGAIHMGYQEIEVTESLTLVDAYLEFTQDCILDLADGVIITPQDVTKVDDPANIGDGQTATSAILISGGTLTINAGEGAGIITNGSTSLDTSCFWLDGGNLVINGGTYKGGTWNDPTGQTYKGASATVYVEEGFAYIYGGEFYGGWSGSMIQTSLLNCLDSNYKNGTANIYCYGGTYQNFDPAACNSEDSSHTGFTNFCAEGYGTVKSDEVDADGFYTYTVVRTVATPADLKAAIAAGDSPIYVTKSMTLDDDLKVTGTCNLVLEDGVVITPCNTYTSGNPDNLYAICIRVNGGDLTVDAGEDAGIMTSGEDDGQNTLIFGVYEGGNLTINGGTYGSSSWQHDADSDTTWSDGRVTVYAYEGFITINGGTFRAGYSNSFVHEGWKVADEENPTAGVRYGGWTEACLNCNDATRKTDESWIYVKGGKFHDFDPACNPVEGAYTNFVVDGYESTLDTSIDGDNWFVVTEKK